MKAVVATGGKQYIVEEGSHLAIEKVSTKTIKLEPLMIIDGAKSKVGSPTVSGGTVEAKVLEEQKGKKTTAIRYKAKKRVHKRRGHRQTFSLIEITSIKAS